MYVSLRPGVAEFLAKVSEHYRIGLFTTGSSDYAIEIKDLLDPNETCIELCLTRSHCSMRSEHGSSVQLSNTIVKDLRILQPLFADSNLSETPFPVLLVDNTPSVFFANPGHGVPVHPFCTNTVNDKELYKLGDYLVNLAETSLSGQDVIKKNSHYFGFGSKRVHIDYQEGLGEILKLHRDLASRNFTVHD